MSLERTILLVENDEAQAEMLRLALGRAGIGKKFQYVADGRLALVQVRDALEQGCAPALVLLDLNLPGLDGLEVLEILKSDPGTRSIPVVVFTSSVAHNDVRRAYACHANAYIHKPRSLSSYVATLREIAHHWLDIVSIHDVGIQ